jgi:hypothetical protein
VPGQRSDQVAPLGPVRGRGDDAAVAEDRLFGVTSQYCGHERQLDERGDAQTEDLVIERVDGGEVDDERTVRTPGHDMVVVVQDRVRPGPGDAQVVVGQPQRLGELDPDHVAITVVPELQLGEALRPDHPPDPIEDADGRGDIDLDVDWCRRQARRASQDR